MEPLISIIVPVYNSEEFLHKCVDSILGQRYRNWETILIDDGSTDNSPEICEYYARTDKRIKVIHRQNGGVSLARNAGIDAAKGEWITFVDSDDWLMEDYLSDMIDAALATECDMVVSGWNINGKEHRLEKHTYEAEDYIEIYRKRIKIGYVCGKLYDRRILNDVRFPIGVKWAEDALFLNSSLLRSRRVAIIDVVNYCYNFHEGTATSKIFTFEDEMRGACKAMELQQEMIKRYSNEIVRYFGPAAHVQRAVQSLYKDEMPRSERLAKLHSIRIPKRLMCFRYHGIKEYVYAFLTLHRQWWLLDRLLSR